MPKDHAWHTWVIVHTSRVILQQNKMSVLLIEYYYTSTLKKLGIFN